MNRAATPVTPPAPPGTPPKRRGRPPKAASSSGAGPGAREPKTTRPGAALKGSPEAKRKASLILEVLGGLRSPTSGSLALGVSVQRYYLLEVRALQGLVTALETKPKRGAPPSPETTMRKLVAERDRLERELLRAQALLRVAQRAVGLAPPAERPKLSPAAKAAGKRGPRRPTVRARRAADELRAQADDATSAAATTEPDTTTPSIVTTPTVTTSA